LHAGSPPLLRRSSEMIIVRFVSRAISVNREGHGMPHILIVEQSQRVRSILRDALVGCGLGASAVATTEDGFVELARRKSDVVVIDLDLPGHGGLTFLRALRADARIEHTPVVMLTSSPEREKILRAAQFGVHGVILKDGRLMGQVVARVRQLLPDVPAPAKDTKPVAAAENRAA